MRIGRLLDWARWVLGGLRPVLGGCIVRLGEGPLPQRELPGHRFCGPGASYLNMSHRNISHCVKGSSRGLAGFAAFGFSLLIALPVGAAGATSHKSQTTPTTAKTTSTTAKKKSSSKKKHRPTKFVPKQKAPTADRISEIQTALAHGGYYQGDPSGKWDASTVSALQKFQSANGIDATGKIDAPSLQKLGLGSDIAGVSAPRPPVPVAAPVAPPASSTPPSGAAPASGASTTASIAPSGGALAGKSTQ